MSIKRSCGLALLLVIGCIVLGSWVRSKFSLPFRQGDRSVNHVGAVACPCPHMGVMACSCPTPTPLSNLDMTSGAHLLIPAIGIDAPVEPVGVLSSGALNVPQKNPWTDVGWYKDGPVPGQSGSAIIDGHLDRPGGVPAVFWNLNRLHKGDVVIVVGTRGQALHFRVVRLRTYRPDAAPLDEIYGDSSGIYLNLITCAGLWIPSQHQTAKRLVVYTSKV